MRYGLKEDHISAIKQCFSQFPEIETAILYGSRAKGNYRPGSDIDLTLIGELPYEKLMQLENTLDDLMLPYKMDISIKSQLSNQDLLDHIERVGVVFYQK